MNAASAAHYASIQEDSETKNFSEAIALIKTIKANASKKRIYGISAYIGDKFDADYGLIYKALLQLDYAAECQVGHVKQQYINTAIRMIEAL